MPSISRWASSEKRLIMPVKASTGASAASMPPSRPVFGSRLMFLAPRTERPRATSARSAGVSSTRSLGKWTTAPCSRASAAASGQGPFQPDVSKAMRGTNSLMGPSIHRLPGGLHSRRPLAILQPFHRGCWLAHPRRTLRHLPRRSFPSQRGSGRRQAPGGGGLPGRGAARCRPAAASPPIIPAIARPPRPSPVR